MAQQFINTGSEANNRTGDPIQNAFKKVIPTLLSYTVQLISYLKIVL